MFTGIVEAVGTLVEVKVTAGGQRVRIQAASPNDLAPGDSLAVNGVCLTAILIDNGEAHFDIGPETARITTLALAATGTGRQPGTGDETRRPARWSSRARACGRRWRRRRDQARGRQPLGDDWLSAAALAPFFIRKGSVAVDGVSLTVAGLGETEFDVQIVPFTFGAHHVRQPPERRPREPRMRHDWKVCRPRPRAGGRLGERRTKDEERRTKTTER